jgi:leucyl-tRNA synthetase
MTNPIPETALYDPEAVETKWQRRWREEKTNATDITGAARPYYNLMMFPYPSAEGLHVGNVFAFVGVDIQGRARRLQGWDVFEPIGFDAFGIHSENYALKVDTHPARLIPRNIARFREQLRRIGLMVDWDHELSTTDPEYYRWTQWIFLQLFNAGIAVKQRAPVNWCPECKTVLANEQVINGYCERHPDVLVHQRYLEQWFFKITDYAERLLENIPKIDWSESTRLMQTNWIGRSHGAELVFATPDGKSIPVYTTRPDTVFGATYVVLAPEHPMVDRLMTGEHKGAVLAYRRDAAAKDLVSRKVGEKVKTGVFTGSYVRNPATGQSVPVWVADYVLMEYGTGAIMAVPGHDQRDFEFARTFDLPIARVVADPESEDALPFEGRSGHLVNSGQFDGMSYEESFPAVVSWLEDKKLARAQVQYRIHDWCISRQRYWGPPIPVVYCDGCGPVGVPEEDLPVVLPDVEDFRPDESGVSPLARHEQWYRVPCPRCGATARRETDVSDTFLDSAWYFLRYPSTGIDDRPFDEALTKKWLPVAQYIGGNEHAVLHLLYARFITMVLKDLGFIDFEEPFRKFRAHGTIVRDGAKMSKSRGNVVNPDEYITKWGADTFRMYLMFLGPYQEGGDFRDQGIAGIRRFLDRVWGMAGAVDLTGRPAASAAVLRKRHQTVKKVTEDVEELRYNTSISALMEYSNTIRAEGGEGALERETVESLVIMLAPFAPHLAEECWERLGHDTSVFSASWPTYQDELTREEELELVVQINGKVRQRIPVASGLSENAARDRVLVDETVQRFVDGKEIRKIIYVPDRLINLVVS